MTEFKKQYLELLERQAVVDQQEAAISESKNQAEKTKFALVKKWILEGGLLAGSSWDLEPQKTDRVLQIICVGDLPEEVKTLRRGWHDFFQITDHIILYFDDNLVTLNFQPEADIREFITAAKLTILTSGIDENIKSLQDRLEALQDLKKSFNQEEGS